MSQRGAIASGHRETAAAGAAMLARGGNAVDAAVAAVYTACTAEATLTGVGGGGFATVKMAGEEPVVVDFFVAVPGLDRTIESATGPVAVEVLFGSTTQVFHVGAQSCAVPGFAAGTLAMHERWGTLPLSDVLAPAIAAARDGVGMSAAQAYCHQLLGDILRRQPEGREVFTPDGALLTDGERFVQPLFADTLEAIVRGGAKELYTGALADQIVAWSNAEEALISRADLERYEVQWHRPIDVRYRDLDLVTTPPPSSGGALVGYALRLLDEARVALGSDALDIDSPEGARLLLAAMGASQAVRTPEYYRRLYAGELNEWLFSDSVLARGHEHVRSAASTAAAEGGSRLGATTHTSVMDGDGNAVSITTSTGCGSGEFVHGTGIHLNNMLGEEDLVPVDHPLVPGARLTSMMAPTIIVRGDDALMCTGSSGSNRLRSAVLQSLVRLVESRSAGDGQASLQQRLEHAVSHARLHPEGGVVHAEPGYAADALDGLREAGHRLNEWPATNLYFGGVNMVARTDDGSFVAAADPRRGGAAVVVNGDGSTEEFAT